MFEVGVKEAGNQLTDLEKRLKELVSKYGSLQIKVEVTNLEKFIRALETIGSGKQLEPLLKRIDVLHSTLAVMGTAGAKSMQDFEAATKVNIAIADQYRKRIEELTKARDVFQKDTVGWRKGEDALTAFKTDKATMSVFAMEKQAIDNLAEAKTRLVNEEKKEGQSASELNSKIEQLSQSISNLSSKTFSVNMGSEFKTWAEQVQALVAQVKELVNQMTRLHQVQGQGNAAAPQGGLFEPQQFKGLQEAIDAVIREINRLKEAFAGIDKIEGIEAMKTSINGLQVEVGNLVSSLTKINGVMHIDKSAEEIAAWEKKIQELKTQYEQLQAQVTSATNTINQQTSATQNAATASKNAGNADEEATKKANIEKQRQLKLLTEVQEMYSRISSKATSGTGLNTKSFSDFRARFEELMNSLGTIPPQKSLQLLAAEFSALKTAAKSFFNEVNKEAKATESLRNVRVALKAIREQMDNGHSSPKLEALRNQLQAINREMSELKKAGKFDAVQTLFSGHKGMSDGALNIIRQVVSAIKEAEKASGSLASGQSSVASAFSKSTSEMFKQSQVLSDLKSMAMQYLSVWGAQSFINKIIDLGGQLEQQRLSIGAILQDTAQANHLFGQIKDLAIKSPFGVQQLDAMTKQLSAYGFQYSELYEWTKRLADISAATGTSVDRLALALGHVRAEGALSGYTLRQFSMGNIPLLQKLSENLGKTKQEIRKMTRNKEIGYEDVLNVLKQLTDKGGMFFEAQEVMSQALNAKFKNLRDSFQIMYSEMAEGAPGDFLKGLATTLTELSRQWQILLPMIGSAGAMWALNRASAALVNVELSKMATLTNANTLASSKYSVAQLRQIANWERMPKAMIRARLTFEGFRASLISLGRYIFSWPTAIFAAVEGIVYMWSKQNRETEKAKELTEAYTNTALESQKNLSKMLGNIQPYEKGLSDSEMKTGIDSMTEAIKNYGVNAQEVFSKVFGSDSEGKVMSLTEKYKTLREELEKAAKVYKEMQRTSDVFEFGVDFTDGGWLDDDVQTDLTNYADALKEYENSFITMTANYGSAVNKALEAAKKASPEFKRIADDLSSDAERVRWLFENQGGYSGVYNVFKGALHDADPNAGGGVLGNQLIGNLRSAERQANKELESFFEGVEAKLKAFGYDFSNNGANLTEVQVGNLLKQSKEWLEKHPEWSNIYDVIWEKLNKRWGIPIVPEVEEIEEKLPQWMADFQEELNGTGIVLKANMSMEDIIDMMKKAYDTAQTTINKLGPIALNAKINIEGLSDEDIEAYNNPSSFLYNPELYNTLKTLKGAFNKKKTVDTAAKKRGVKLEGMKKDGSHKAEKQNTEAAKAVRERVRVIKEAADAFQYWREKVGDKGAWEHVQSEFGDVLAKIGITASNIEDVRSHLKNIRNTKEFKAITDKKIQTETEKELSKEEDQFIRKDFERDTERFLSQTQIQLDSLTRSWELFNKIREATGDVELAVKLSSAEYEGGKTRNIADALKAKIQKDFDIAGGGIEFNLNFSDEEIEDKIKDAMPKASQKQIKGLVEEYKKWRDLQRDVLMNDIQVFSSLAGSAVNYESQIKKIVAEMQTLIESNEALRGSGASDEQIDYANEVARIQGMEKAWKATESYAALFNNSLSMTRDELQNGVNVAVAILEEKMRLNLITAHEYSQEMEKLRKIMREFDSNGLFGVDNGFTSFLKGGIQGLNTYYDRMIERNTRLAEEAKNNRDYKGWAQYMNDAEGYKQAQKKLANFTNSLSGAALIVEMVTGTLDGFQKAAQSLSNMFDALGKSGAASDWSDIADTIGAINSTFNGTSSVLQNAMSGNIGGTISSAIAAPIETFTAPITAFAKLHDKKRERQLEELRHEVQKVDNTLNLIKSLRERTMGYDNGDLRRQLAALYRNSNNESGQAMYEYYSRGGLQGSGYKQELEALKKQRQMYQEMYDTEADKKKASSEALEEYKAKMSELDITIQNYAKDIANELYGMDLKSWASQIGDSLMTAFENGEDAAKAFDDSVQDIMRSVLNNMLSLGILEPMMENLRKKLFGENGKGGVFDATNPEGTIDAAMQEVATFFGEGGEGQQMIQATETFYKKWQEFMRSKGLTLEEDRSSSASGSIKSITEQTGDLLASYVNGIRGDLSAHRAMFAQYAPMYYAALTTGNASLRNIENHTAAIMRSNDTIAERVGSLDDRFRRLENRAWRVPMA